MKTGGGSGVGGGTYCARACAIKTQAPKTTADPLNKSCAGVIRSNLLVGIAVSFTGDVLLPLIDHTGAKLSLAKPLESAYSASDKSPTRALRQQAAAPVHRFSRFCNIHRAAHGGQAARGRRALARIPSHRAEKPIMFVFGWAPGKCQRKATVRIERVADGPCRSRFLLSALSRFFRGPPAVAPKTTRLARFQKPSRPLSKMARRRIPTRMPANARPALM